MRLRTMSIVSSRGTLVNKLTTSNETSEWPSGTCLSFMRVIKSFVLCVVYSDLANGRRRDARCFAISYGWVF